MIKIWNSGKQKAAKDLAFSTDPLGFRLSWSVEYFVSGILNLSLATLQVISFMASTRPLVTQSCHTNQSPYFSSDPCLSWALTLLNEFELASQSKGFLQMQKVSVALIQAVMEPSSSHCLGCEEPQLEALKELDCLAGVHICTDGQTHPVLCLPCIGTTVENASILQPSWQFSVHSSFGMLFHSRKAPESLALSDTHSSEQRWDLQGCSYLAWINLVLLWPGGCSLGSAF